MHALSKPGYSLPMLCLTLEFEGRLRRVPLGTTSVVRLGSAPGNDVVIPSAYVSRSHAELRLSDGQATIKDLGSLNGTFVGDRRISSECLQIPTSVRLGRGVLLRIQDEETDKVRLAIELGERPSVRATTRETSPARGSSLPASMRTAIAGRLADGSLLDGSPPTLASLVEAVSGVAGAPVAALWLLDGAAPSWASAVVFAAEGALPEDDGWLAACMASLEAGTGLGRPRPDGPAFIARRDGEGTLMLVLPAEPDRADAAWLLDAVARLSARTRGSRAARDPYRRIDLEAAGFVASRSPLVRALHERMAAALTSDLAVLLTGPTGCGKEVYARTLHLQSKRGAGPFQAINAAALPETLLESLLFGTVDGAATGVRGQGGLLREADGGTFFLDEIGEMTLALQAKLLRVLDEHRVLPVGATKSVAVDVRFIAASNRDLDADVAVGRFRADLHHRLRGHEFEIPALATRLEDVPAYVAAFLRSECEASGRHLIGMTVQAMRTLQALQWPGNVRQLESVVRRLVHEVPSGAAITHEDVLATVDFPCDSDPGQEALETRLEGVRREAITEALRLHGGNRARAAEHLGVSRGGLRIMMKRLGLEGA